MSDSLEHGKRKYLLVLADGRPAPNSPRRRKTVAKPTAKVEKPRWHCSKCKRQKVKWPGEVCPCVEHNRWSALTSNLARVQLAGLLARSSHCGASHDQRHFSSHFPSVRVASPASQPVSQRESSSLCEPRFALRRESDTGCTVLKTCEPNGGSSALGLPCRWGRTKLS